MAQVLPFKAVEPAPAAAALVRPRRPYLGDILVRKGQLAQAHLDEALSLQEGQDAPLGQILIVSGHLSPEALIEALSQQAELGRVDLDAAPPDPRLTAGADPYACRELEAVPWRRFGGRPVIAIANPGKNGDEARRRLGKEGTRPALIVASPQAIRRAISHQFGLRMARDAEDRCGEVFSCRTLIAHGMTARKWALLAGIAGSVALAPWLSLQFALAWTLFATVATTGLRLVAIFARLRGGPVALAGTPRLVDYRRLPPVSIIVPLKNEAAVTGQLLAALGRMQYPAPLLDVKLVLEAGDLETRAAIDRAGLPPTIEVVAVPAGTIQTKPRAMNYALPFCRGDIVGIYDAEDKPDPGQIRAVVQHLMDAPPDVACVQGYLDFYNTDRNWLSRCFTIEYAVWFRVVLQGVQRLGLPIPLGGTTVFFRRRHLEEIGGWDAHNVTEDADLGMRLVRFGYRCEMLATITEEEANCGDAGSWIRQRSRWLKGYAITWGTHMRNPRALLRDLGIPGFIGFQVIFLGGLTSFLALPILWLLWGASFGFDLAIWARLGPLPGLVIAATLVGEAVMLGAAAVALSDSRRLRLLPWLATLPLYWPLGAAAAWRALAELFYAPFHWHKTAHGAHLPPGGHDPA